MTGPGELPWQEPLPRHADKVFGPTFGGIGMGENAPDDSKSVTQPLRFGNYQEQRARAETGDGGHRSGDPRLAQ